MVSNLGHSCRAKRYPRSVFAAMLTVGLGWSRLGRPGITLGQNFWGCEEHTVGRRVGCGRHCHLRPGGREQLDAHEQGEVLMHGVVAVVDVGATVLAKLHLERDLGLVCRTQPPHVLPDQALRCRNGGAAPVDGDAFLEVQMDGVVPAVATIDERPVFDLAGLGNELGDAVGVERVRRLAVDLDGPGEGCKLRAVWCALSRCPTEIRLGLSNLQPRGCKLGIATGRGRDARPDFHTFSSGIDLMRQGPSVTYTCPGWSVDYQQTDIACRIRPKARAAPLPRLGVTSHL